VPKFDFDGEERLIFGREDAVIDGVFRFTVEELYSEWKEWVHEGEGAKFPPAFRVLGGDPIGGGIFVGVYVFLRTDLGWRGVPPLINNVVVEITGNFYPEVPGDPVMVIIENYTTTLKVRNSNLSQGVATESTTIDIPAIVQAILEAAQSSPIYSDVRNINGAEIRGTGSASDKWRGVGV